MPQFIFFAFLNLLGAFSNLRKAEISAVSHDRPSVRLSVLPQGTTRIRLNGSSRNFIADISLKSAEVQVFRVWLKSEKNIRHVTLVATTFMSALISSVINVGVDSNRC